VTEDGRLDGIFTDGDLRRRLETMPNLIDCKASEVMILGPKTICEDAILDAALAIMEEFAITQLPTVTSDGRLAGIIHLHDILKSKLV
jgi:arabinose-5-phosphate isomerase